MFHSRREFFFIGLWGSNINPREMDGINGWDGGHRQMRLMGNGIVNGEIKELLVIFGLIL
jgi:hypothetical protein